MHRFYYPKSNFKIGTLELVSSKELHHICNVLRLKPGEKVTLFNGENSEAEGIIESLTLKSAKIKINKVKKIKEIFPKIILACAIPKKSKFEMIIEKATELGADEIVPLNTQRTNIKIKGDRLKTKMTRYQSVAVNAAKQCQRADIPVIHPITKFSQVIKERSKDTKIIIPSLQGKRLKLIDTLKNLPPAKRIMFLIGPEGDFTDQEYREAKHLKCIPVTLGKNILKVETAAITALSCACLNFRS